MTGGTEREQGTERAEGQGGIPAPAPLCRAVIEGDVGRIRRALADGANVNELDAATGLAALHYAVGLNDLPITRFLAEECGAAFIPDRFGRWPTLIAAENRVDDALSDYIVEKEAAYLAAHPQQAS
jgi:uncharacterized protein